MINFLGYNERKRAGAGERALKAQFYEFKKAFECMEAINERIYLYYFEGKT